MEILEKTENKKKTHLHMLMIILVILVLMIVASIIIFLLKDNEDPTQTVVEADRHSLQNKVENLSLFSELGIMYPLDSFIVNLLSNKGRRYLRVSMDLEVNHEEVCIDLEEKSVIIRDIIIRVLSSKSIEEIITHNGKEKLKKEIITSLNGLIVENRISNVYFTEFVIQ